MKYQDKDYSHSEFFSHVTDAEEMTRDQAIITAVMAGVTLNTATKKYAEWAKAEGLTTGIISHKVEALKDLLDEYGDAEMSIDECRTAVASLQAVYDVVESTAKDYVKAHLDVNSHAWPVLNPRDAMFAWFKSEGDEADHAEFIAFACDPDGLNRSRSNANEYWKGFELHLHLVA